MIIKFMTNDYIIIISLLSLLLYNYIMITYNDISIHRYKFARYTQTIHKNVGQDFWSVVRRNLDGWENHGKSRIFCFFCDLGLKQKNCRNPQYPQLMQGCHDANVTSHLGADLR